MCLLQLNSVKVNETTEPTTRTDLKRNYVFNIKKKKQTLHAVTGSAVVTHLCEMLKSGI